jgi:hypothetical protein
MENENINTSPDRKRIYFILMILSSVIIVYSSIMFILSPAERLKKESEEFSGRNEELLKADEKILFDSAYIKLMEEKSFLQSKVMMAETDSIYLSINLSDSIADIEISGVVVHSARINSRRVSKIFYSGDDYLILSMLSSPLTINKDYSTIEKEPLSFKMAPKDTSEYKPDILPDTSDVEPVNYIFEMENGIKICIYQSESTTFAEKKSRFYLDLGDRLRNAWNSFKSVAMFRIPEYHPRIKLRLNKADAKIIYRALPLKGQVAVHR